MFDRDIAGLALEEQMVQPDQSIPTGALDWHLDRLIIGNGVILSEAKTSISQQ